MWTSPAASKNPTLSITSIRIANAGQQGHRLAYQHLSVAVLLDPTGDGKQQLSIKLNKPSHILGMVYGI